jgi:hypothetical protein
MRRDRLSGGDNRSRRTVLKKYVVALTADGRPDQAPPTLPDNGIEAVYARVERSLTSAGEVVCFAAREPLAAQQEAVSYCRLIVNVGRNKKQESR